MTSAPTLLESLGVTASAWGMPLSPKSASYRASFLLEKEVTVQFPKQTAICAQG